MDDNKMWGSKFILPEHREAMTDYNRHKLKKLKPDLDSQKLDEFTYVINESIENGKNVVITEFDEFEDKIIIGKITRIDQKMRRLRIENGNEITFVPLEDILHIELDKR